MRIDIRKLIMVVAMTAPMTVSACFLSGERISGMNKICYYDCVSGTRAITISAISLCPLSLYRDMLAIIGLPCGDPQ